MDKQQQEAFSGKISLVTGGAGFIGSHVADELLKIGHKVIVLDDLSGGFKRNVNKDCIFVEGSTTDEEVLDKIFEDYRVDYIFHLAAYAAEGLSHFIRKFNYENNLIGSINLINRAVKFNIKRFIFTSSIAVYGTNQTPMVETLAPLPEDPYGVSKYAVELDLKAAHEMFGLNYTIFRPHNVYGEKQNHGDAYRNVLGIFINNIMKGKPMTIFGDGKQTRAFSYIGDVAPCIARSIDVPESENEIFNIGADKPYTVLELAEVIAKYMGVKANIEFLPARNEVVNAYSSHEKVKKVFGIQNETSLDEGIMKMVKWSKEIGPMDSIKFKNIELTKNMPPSWQKLI
ncbi:MAG: NAD-dependent epimerase/dehydratase family protein [bacterium]